MPQRSTVSPGSTDPRRRSTPTLPTARQQGYPQHAYLLMRPGRPIIYHHARGVTRSGGFAGIRRSGEVRWL